MIPARMPKELLQGYQQGDCRRLARALQELLGGEVWGVAPERALSAWQHAFLRRGDLCIDITGSQLLGEMLTTWTPATGEAPVAVRMEPAFSFYDVRECDRRVAHMLIDQLPPEGIGYGAEAHAQQT
jgi:hypothetical protein